ncbi:hypothetical protein AQZ52_03505 [Novosphingobium fuchskuhlense]|uniref:Uncharacterized protein n=1 Tax=Novosphingobium fuchskuhlense TaxID=1117702 RepID=A0A117UWW0_9SPHN|nr:hypothetical protein AQZ52_03505 [Novosphingobium fuchskuhlense]
MRSSYGKKEIRRSKSEDFEIIEEEGGKVGTVRIKPSGILWKPKGKHKWLGVSVEEFAEFAEKNGKEQTR